MDFIPVERFPARLVEARSISPSVRALSFERSDGEPFEYVSGQWVKLYLREGLDRDYSIASAPDPAHDKRFELAVTRVEGGPGSGLLHAMEVGTTLEVLGPSGFFTREPEHRAKPALYVGTGTGVAPLRAMLQEELRASEGPQQVLLFGCRSEADLLYLDAWRALERACPRFRFAPTLSRGGDAWAGRRGYVQAHVPELVGQLGEGLHVYICGLSRMVGEVRNVLRKELGLDRKQVHSERYD